MSFGWGRGTMPGIWLNRLPLEGLIPFRHHCGAPSNLDDRQNASPFSFPQTATALILIPAISRRGMVLAIYAFPFARPQGLGKPIMALPRGSHRH